MKTIVTVLLLVALAGVAAAQSVSTTIPDIRAGMHAEGTQVDVVGGQAIVTAVRYNGFSATDPAAGPYTAIWVYTGGAPGVVEGDIVDIVNGEYKEYYDLSEIDMNTFAGTVTVVGSTTVPYLPMTHAALRADFEAWESHVIHVTDGFLVTAMLSYGEWTARSYDDGYELLFDDYFFDETTLAVDYCYWGVTGMLSYSFGAYKLNPLADGLTVIDCTVGNEDLSFGGVKSLFR